MFAFYKILLCSKERFPIWLLGHQRCLVFIRYDQLDVSLKALNRIIDSWGAAGKLEWKQKPGKVSAIQLWARSGVKWEEEVKQV